MSITIHPDPGQILVCDFSRGFVEPEMVKSRPVIVLSSRSKLVTVVPLSTVKPNPIERYHYLLDKAHLPQLGHFQQDDSWIKGDMIYTVGFHRLDLIRLNKRDPLTNKRLYFSRKLPLEVLKEVRACVLHGLKLSYIVGNL